MFEKLVAGNKQAENIVAIVRKLAGPPPKGYFTEFAPTEEEKEISPETAGADDLAQDSDKPTTD